MYMLPSVQDWKKNQTAVSKCFGILPTIMNSDNNARELVKTASSTTIFVCLVGCSVNCEGL